MQAKLDNKKKDIEKLLEKERTLNMNFQVSLGENNKFADYLNKVFKKKIKRTKKKATEGDGKYIIILAYVPEESDMKLKLYAGNLSKIKNIT